MLVQINKPEDLGLAIRATRKVQKLRLDDTAAFAGVGPVFAMDVEHGKPTVQLGRVLRLLEQLGLQLKVDMPDVAVAMFETLRARGLRPRKKRASAPRPGNER